VACHSRELVIVVTGRRWSLTGTGDPPSRMVLVSAVVMVALLMAGMMYFQKKESKIADVV
jgi:ABC-type polysaccharide/polyol phosphate export permease